MLINAQESMIDFSKSLLNEFVNEAFFPNKSNATLKNYFLPERKPKTSVIVYQSHYFVGNFLNASESNDAQVSANVLA